MFIELAEFLRCPHCNDDKQPCVLVPEEMVGRRVAQGSIGCPVCKNVYPIRDGVALLDLQVSDPPLPASGRAEPVAPPGPSVVQALLGLASPGGYVVLVGEAARVARGLARLLDGVHFVGINAPPDVEPSPVLSLLRGWEAIPLTSSMARGVVLDHEHGRAPWLSEAARLVLRGLRVVVFGEGATVPGVEQLASGGGLWVGQKR
ncbi:MAG: hypothetical protein GTN62_13785 [Gemmatimonadales bacterium]|nr:hypothetical protein [Gemmatimonadales bacterium]NIP08622.1 hypothetical protein [Gemmatimonadales bacterium]NIR02310.1 hypothetical protein [Gemmatimonadales bacterium]